MTTHDGLRGMSRLSMMMILVVAMGLLGSVLLTGYGFANYMQWLEFGENTAAVLMILVWPMMAIMDRLDFLYDNILLIFCSVAILWLHSRCAAGAAGKPGCPAVWQTHSRTMRRNGTRKAQPRW